MTEQNEIKDGSSDRKYFTITPRLVWALCRDPFEFSLWCVIKDIAGEKGECYLATEDLAVLAMQSAGKASQARQYLIKCGVLKGQVRKDPGYPQPVWHLEIPDLWPRNIEIATRLISIRDRIEWKKQQRETLLGQKVCTRCTELFYPSGRRSHRCLSCQKAVKAEKARIYRRDSGLRQKLIDELGCCQQCGRQKPLELHHVGGVEVDNGKVELLCTYCHDVRHGGSVPSPYEGTGVPSPHEEGSPCHEEGSPLYETKKNQEEEPKADPPDTPAFPEAAGPSVHPTIERLRQEAGADYLDLAAHCAGVRDAAGVPQSLDQRPKGWQTESISDAEFAICQRVADLWAGGKMAGLARFVDSQVEAAGEVLRMFEGDVGKALETIMLYHEQYEADWQRTGQRPFTVAGPQSLVNVLRTFEAEAGYETEAPPRARRMLF